MLPWVGVTCASAGLERRPFCLQVSQKFRFIVVGGDGDVAPFITVRVEPVVLHYEPPYRVVGGIYVRHPLIIAD